MNNTRSALQILTEIRDGNLIVETSEAIKTACAAVTEHNKPAKVTIELTIKPFKDGQHLIEQPLVFIGDVETKLPEADPVATLFFVGEDGNATRNPGERQPALGLTVAGSDNTKKANT
jgi:hypothetical protein